jgi:hypothetical protein
VKKRLAAMGVAIITGGGYVALTVAGFYSELEDPAWGRLANCLLGASIIASVIWGQVTFAVIPRTAYRLGFESGERHSRRKDKTRQLIPFPVLRPAQRNGTRR